MLPGVPPTNRRVEVVLVSIMSLRAGRLYSEHMYWDQASVLVQVGLLDPKLVPEGAPEGVDRLPVIGREAARRIVEEDPEADGRDYHNRLIRRARAKKGKDKAPAEESGTELAKSDAEKPVGESKGKNVQRNGQQNGKDTDGLGNEHDGVGQEEEEEEEEKDGVKHQNGGGKTPNPAAATVEDSKSDE